MQQAINPIEESTSWKVAEIVRKWINRFGPAHLLGRSVDGHCVIVNGATYRKLFQEKHGDREVVANNGVSLLTMAHMPVICGALPTPDDECWIVTTRALCKLLNDHYD